MRVAAAHRPGLYAGEERAPLVVSHRDAVCDRAAGWEDGGDGDF